MTRLLSLSALFALLCACAACGGAPVAGVRPQPAAAPRIVAFSGSDWTGSELQAAATPSGADTLVELTSQAATPARTLLLELQFDPSLQAEVLSATPALQQPDALSLVATGHPGVVGLGLILPAGQSISAGPLLSLRLHPAGALARSASAAPQGKFGEVTDLTVTNDGVLLHFAWSYRNAGDCDQNSEVNVADLSALAPRLHQRTDDGDQDDTDEVLDADGNGEINPSDLSTIGQNYHGTVGHYSVAQIISAISRLELTTTSFPLGTSDPHTRRQFAATVDTARVGTGTVSFEVIPESGFGPGSEGAVSNVVSLDLTPPQPPKFEVPPTGQQEPDAAAALSPSLVRMPAISGVSAAGAPVIVYLDTAGVLTLAYYNSGAWVRADISGGASYTAPQALWTGSGGLVLAFEPASQKLRALAFDNLWVSTGSPGGAFTAGVADVPGMLDADYDSAIGKVGVVASYTTATGQRIVYSELSAGSWTNTDIYPGSGQAAEVLGGLSFRFDPQGGQPWCVYTVGTTDIDLANTKFTITTTLNLGRFDGAAWNVTPVSYPDSPLQVDLGFDAAGTAQLALNAARNYHLSIPTVGSYDLSILLDGTVGSYAGGTFGFPANPVFKSSASFGLLGGLPPTGVKLNLNLATGASLAGPAGVCFAENSGELDFDLTFAPTGGSLAPATEFYSNSGGTWSKNNFYAGSAGRSFAWADDGTTLSTAYLLGVTLDSTNLGNLTSGLASNLEYWSP